MPLPLIPVAITAVTGAAAYFAGSKSGKAEGKALEAKKQTTIKRVNTTLIVGSVLVSGVLAVMYLKKE